jgi:tetratricopeptide (TPR) repeat protein
MRKNRSPLRLAAAALIPAAALFLLFHLVREAAPADPPPISAAQGPTATSSEAVLRLNNLGIAEMEQFHFSQAAGYFEKARTLDPQLTAASVNLAMALFYDRRNEEAERLLKEVLAKVPNQREAHYLLGLLYRSTGKNEEALAEMKAVLALDPQDPSTLYFTGALNSAQHKWDQAVEYLRSALVRDPINVSIYYALATALVQKGDTAQAEKVMGQFQELKSRGTGTSYGNQYLEQGRYAQAMQVASSGQSFTSADAGRPRFVEAEDAGGLDFVHGGPRDTSIFDSTGGPRPEAAAAFGSGIAVLDYDGDGWPDVFLASAAGPGSLYRNNHDGTFKAVSGTGIGFKGKAMGVAAGDYDNDGSPDLFIAGLDGSALYHNDGKGLFSDKTSLLSPLLAQSWATTAAFIDLDHDGDLDLFVACGAKQGQPDARNLLYRNNGDGSFTETAESSGVARSGFAGSAAFMDYNGSRDIDILLVAFPQWKLFSNKRDGSFADVTAAAGLPSSSGSLGVAAGDFDSDGRIDLCSAGPGRPGTARVLWNQPTGYKVQEIPVGSRAPLWNAVALDYDNDGDLDILLAGDELRLLENDGRRGFTDVTAAVGLDRVDAAGARSAAVADYDQDGDLDLVINRCGRTALLLRNDGGNRNHVFRLSLRGKADNHFGVGAKVEWAAGGLWQHREPDGGAGYLTQSAGDVLLGLGRFAAPDYVRVLWPTGVLQSEMPAKDANSLVLTELDRKGTSCPLLYAWNGSAYGFVTDFLGGSAMGYLEEPGRYGVPDTDEYVKIASTQLLPKGPVLSLKMVNQLEEVMLFDAVRLLAVDHPAGMEVFPNERLMAFPPFPEHRIYTATAPRPVLAASDDDGSSWTRALESVDRDYVRNFRLLPFKGYAEEHSLTLDLGDLRGSSRAVLLMDGWIDYANSSSNFSAAQAGVKLIPPYLQVWESGRWRTVLSDMGFPAGLPKTMLVDLSGKIPPAPHARIRIVTSMRIYWDRIRIETAAQDTHLKVTSLEPQDARTSWVGYPREWSPDGRAPFGYDYARRDAEAPWKLHAGKYTPLGDVRELLGSVDDRYVVLAHGEEITAEFPSGGLPGLPHGWVRDWLLYVDGFGKDMDLHSQYPDTVEPLPRHRDLPYRSPSWSLPTDTAWDAFRRTFLTRSGW